MKNKWILAILAAVLMVVFAVAPCLANAAEPPSILIIVSNPPEDMEINLLTDSNGKATVINHAFERYYAFYYRDLKEAEDYTFQVATSEDSFQIPLAKPVKTYNNIFTLDLDRQTLEPGKSWSRSASLVSFRVLLTLIIEGLIFWLFGYREKRSWYAFVVINLLTQGALNIWLNELSPLASYIILNLIFGEVQVFVVEMIVLMAFLREHSRLRTFAYVMIANILSLIVGGYIITYLPV